MAEKKTGLATNRGLAGNSMSGMTSPRIQQFGYTPTTKKTTTTAKPFVPMPGTNVYGFPVGTPVKTPTPKAEDPYAAELRRQTEAILQQTSALNAQIASQPKLIYRDTNAAWQTAQNKAATTVNPVYQDYLTQFQERQANAKLQREATLEAAKKASDTTLTQTNEDILTAKERTAEDTLTGINQNLTNETDWQKSEGKTSNNEEEQARLALGDSGIMGRGAGQLEEAKLSRNEVSDIKTRTFKEDRNAQRLVEKRTYADLETKGSRAVSFNETEKADLDRQLSDFIVNQGTEATQFKSENESARLGAIGAAAGDVYKSDTAAWLATLNGNQRAQDIALTTQVYGGR